MMTPMFIFMGGLFCMGCIGTGVMLFIAYDKLSKTIENNLNHLYVKLNSEILHSSGRIITRNMVEADNILSDIKVIKRSIPNVISHLYDIEKSKLFGARLRSWRHKLQLTQKDVFNRSGVCVGRISDIERGINPSEDERGILSRMMTAEALVAPDKPDGDLIENVKVEFKPDGALDFEKKKNELEV